MTDPALHHKITYLEFTTTDITKTRAFYATVFGWNFKDWGPDYIDFKAADGGIAGGFAKGEPVSSKGAPLAVLYSADLVATQAAVLAAGGTIVTPTFTFPGGRRFHFADGTGNVLAVWSE